MIKEILGVDKKILLVIIVLALGLAACGGGPASEEQKGELESLRLPMGFIPNVQYAPFYVAVEKGYFAEAGFELIFDYSFETDGVALVGAGELPFAVVSGEQVLLARAQAIPVVYITAWFQDYPVAVVTKSDSGIATVADLVGKRIGVPGLFGATYVGLRALLASEGIAEEDVFLDSIGFNQVEALATDQEDAVVGYINNEPLQLANLGYEVHVLAVRDAVQLAANGIIGNESYLADNPERATAFVAAFLRGLSDAIADPNEAFEISKKYVETLASGDQDLEMQVLLLTIEFWKAEQLGASNADAWTNMQQVLLDMGSIAEPLDLDKAFTNEFVGVE
jgi:NitT/TauT family transport system substrate-binding protein